MKMPLTRLTVKEPFKSLFPVEPDIVEALTADMKANGFDAARSIIAWKAPSGELVLADGHMRLLAATAARLKEVHVTVRRFTDEDAAFMFAVASQRDRRNLTQLEIASAIARAEEARKPISGKVPLIRSGPGRPVEDLVRQEVVKKAAKAGVSTRTADRALAKVRAENGTEPKTKPRARTAKKPAEAPSMIVTQSRSDEALATYRILALLNGGQLATQMHTTLRAMVKLTAGLDRDQAKVTVSTVWGILDSSYQDKRQLAELVKLATQKETTQ